MRSSKFRPALIVKWLKIGRANPWVRLASDPPFTAKMIHLCATPEELIQYLRHGNWCLGQAFAWSDQCWIQQVNGGDEWLVIKQGRKFESITSRGFSDEELLELILRINISTPQQCVDWKYEELPKGWQRK